MPLIARLPVAVLLIAVSTAVHALDVRNARSPEPPDGAPVMAGYMEVYNHGDDDVRITGASSPVFDRVEIHRTITENDTTRMESIDTLELAAGSREDFVPRGMHLMLFTPSKPFTEGDRFRIELATDAGTIEVDFRVVDPQMLDHDDASAHDH